MVGWHHRLNGYESEQTPGNSEGQGSLVYRSPWSHKESDTTQRLNINNLNYMFTMLRMLKKYLLNTINSGQNNGVRQLGQAEEGPS